MLRPRTAIATISLLLFTLSAFGQIPRLISYQGILTDTSGTPRPDGPYNFTFNVYPVSSGGSALWTETKSIQVKRGLFSTMLGSVSPFPDSLKFDRQYWLGIQVAPDPELLPRIQLTSVGSSFNSLRADVAQSIALGQVVKSINNLRDDLTMRGANGASVTTNGDTITITASGGGGGGIGTIQNTDNALSIVNPSGPTTTVNVKIPFTVNGNVGVGTTSPQSRLHVNGTSWFQGDNTPLPSAAGKGIGIGFPSAGDAGYVFAFDYNALTPKNLLLNSPGGNVGIGTTTPLSKLDIAAQDGLRIIGYQPYLTLTDANAGNARAVMQNANGSFAFFTATDLPTGLPTLTINSSGGLLAKNPSTAASATAVTGVITSSSPGTSSAAVKGVNSGLGDNGVGVWGEQEGNGFGVYGSSPAGSGVYAVSTTGYGVLAGSTSGVGVKGASGGAYSVVGQNYASATTFGALGYHGDFPATNTRAAVFGYSSSGEYSGYFNGQVLVDNYSVADYALVVNHGSIGQAAIFYGQTYVDGDFIVSGRKNFMIDHPLDPANKYLFHSCIESPDCMNVYSGNVTTDATGQATVGLPNYFEALNTDYRYQLTVIGQFAQAIVLEKIHENRFVIKTDKPGVEVSWQVTGIRNDAYTKANPTVVEKDKAPNERGKYLMPELFGQPAEKGIHYLPASKAPESPGPALKGKVGSN